MGLRDKNHTHIDHTFNQGKNELCGSYHLLSSSISMANLSSLVAASFSNLALLSSSISTANLSCLLATTFSSLSFLSNSFSSPHFNLLRVARCCFSWSSVSDDLFFSFGSPSCSIFFASVIDTIATVPSIRIYCQWCILPLCSETGAKRCDTYQFRTLQC